MMTLQTTSRITFGVGFFSIIAVILANMALQDIYHGESDLTLEWRVLRLAFLIIIGFHVFALTVAWKASGFGGGSGVT